MKFALTPIALATLVATTPLASVAHAQAAKAPAAPVVKPASAKPTITTKAPDDWIVYDDATYTPVVDDVSRHLSAARKAFDSKDTKKAAQEMRAVSDALEATGRPGRQTGHGPDRYGQGVARRRHDVCAGDASSG